MGRLCQIGTTLGLSLLLSAACTTTRVRSYQDPSISTTALSSIAVLPLQNTRLGPQIAIGLNRGVVQALGRRNPNLKIMGPAEAQEKLSSSGLIETYSQYLRDYGTSGLVNKAALVKMGDALGVDAILQGDISELEQQDGYPYHAAYIKLTLRYSVVSLKSGVLLWESSATVKHETTAMNKAPELEEVVPTAQSTLIAQMPAFK